MNSVRSYRLELDASKHPVLVTEKEISYNAKSMNMPEKIVDLCNEMMRLKFLAEEEVIMIATDIKCNVLGVFRVSHGNGCSAICSNRELFIRALSVGASAIFIIHNHPSGDCTPSEDDLKTKDHIKKAGKLLGITLNDFLIIGDNEFYSAKRANEL